MPSAARGGEIERLGDILERVIAELAARRASAAREVQAIARRLARPIKSAPRSPVPAVSKTVRAVECEPAAVGA